MKKFLIALPVLLIAAVLSTVTYIEQGELGLTWNSLTGELGTQEVGFHVSSPFTLVSVVETRPQRVCITSSAHAAPNCRLVQFVPERYKEFLAVEGWRYYWFDNLISFNSGHEETYRGFRDVLRGYAFSAQEYPFVETHTYQ